MCIRDRLCADSVLVSSRRGIDADEPAAAARLEAIRAVSYTHLDVYKRQALSSSVVLSQVCRKSLPYMPLKSRAKSSW